MSRGPGRVQRGVLEIVQADALAANASPDPPPYRTMFELARAILQRDDRAAVESVRRAALALEKGGHLGLWVVPREVSSTVSGRVDRHLLAAQAVLTPEQQSTRRRKEIERLRALVGFATAGGHREQAIEYGERAAKLDQEERAYRLSVESPPNLEEAMREIVESR